jgi:ATP-binding protein involved in chromosome partitioning
MFEKVNVPVLGLIENMSYFISPTDGARFDIFGSGGGERGSEANPGAVAGPDPDRYRHPGGRRSGGHR